MLHSPSSDTELCPSSIVAQPTVPAGRFGGGGSGGSSDDGSSGSGGGGSGSSEGLSTDGSGIFPGVLESGGFGGYSSQTVFSKTQFLGP